MDFSKGRVSQGEEIFKKQKQNQTFTFESDYS